MPEWDRTLSFRASISSPFEDLTSGPLPGVHEPLRCFLRSDHFQQRLRILPVISADHPRAKTVPIARVPGPRHRSGSHQTIVDPIIDSTERDRLRKAPISPLFPERATTAFLLTDDPHAIAKSGAECEGRIIIDAHLRPLLDPTTTEWIHSNSNGSHRGPLQFHEEINSSHQPRSATEPPRS
jgi:hypothetical protein